MLKGKTAIVTGGVRGIGKAIALALVEKGVNVALCYRGNEEAAKITQEEIEKLQGNVILFKGDVKDSSFAKEVIEATKERFASIDILVNNAGITKDKLILRMNQEDFTDVIDTNLTGSFNFLKACGEVMVKQRYGRIINLSSIVGINGNPGQSNYSASKAGIIGLTKSAAKELGRRGITVNAIAPGFIETDMTDILNEAQKAELLKGIPIGRVGTSKDIASLAVFLASEEAGYITGQVIGVDGGM
jgi:3-oxoacyl-[acyl-carrier protein] reductase